jgi:RNA polymerase sigma-70 factor (ECF subfamily)
MTRQDDSTSHIMDPRHISRGHSQAGATASRFVLETQRLVVAAQSGSQAAFSELFSRYSQSVYRTAFAITKNAADAEDALQESFLRAFTAINRFEARAIFYTWLTRIAINSALMTVRKRRTRPECSPDTSFELGDDIAPMDFRDPSPDPEQICSRRQRCSTLIQAIDGLAPILRDVARTRLMEECSVRELAAKFNISEAAAKSRFYRARARLGAFPIAHSEAAVAFRGSSIQVSSGGRKHHA